jgi:hypothetical protein
MLNRVRDKLRSLGWADTLWFIVDSMLRRASFGSAKLIKYYFVAQPVAPGTTSGRGSSSMRLYVAHDCDDVIRQAPRPSRTLLSRFEQHSRCVVAERDGQLAGFVWLCPGRYREDEVRCVYRWDPAPVAVWDFDVFIAPPFRMGRLFARLWERAHQLLAAENVLWTLSRIDAFNAGSLAAHRRLGARDVARGWFLVVGRLQIMVASAAPFCHVSLRDTDAPELRFDLAKLDVRPGVMPSTGR